MDSKLNDDEINALQSLDPDSTSDRVKFRDGDLPQRLFAFNLVTRHPAGATVLTDRGERALFRHECIRGLAALARGEATRLPSGVRNWLVSSGFILEGRVGQSAQAITQRGKLWLASFEKDADVQLPELTAADFALRRG